MTQIIISHFFINFCRIEIFIATITYPYPKIHIHIRIKGTTEDANFVNFWRTVIFIASIAYSSISYDTCPYPHIQWILSNEYHPYQLDLREHQKMTQILISRFFTPCQLLSHSNFHLTTTTYPYPTIHIHFDMCHMLAHGIFNS